MSTLLTHFEETTQNRTTRFMNAESQPETSFFRIIRSRKLDLNFQVLLHIKPDWTVRTPVNPTYDIRSIHVWLLDIFL